MLAFESDTGVIWLDDVVDSRPSYMSPNSHKEHTKLYGTFEDVFEDYDRVSMLTQCRQLSNGFVHSTIGGIQASQTSLISCSTFAPQLHRIKDYHTGTDYYALDAVSPPIIERLGHFFAVKQDVALEIRPERAIQMQPSAMRLLRKLVERYVILPGDIY